MGKYIWTQEKIDFIVNNNTKIPDSEIMEHLGISNNTYYKKKRELGLACFLWTNDKIDILTKVYPTGSWDEIYKAIGCDKKYSIISMASQYGIKRKEYNERKLTDRDKKFIQQNSLSMSVDEISININKKKSQIFNFCKKNNIDYFYNGQVKPWEVDLFKSLYPFYTNKFLHQKYFSYLSSQQINSNARKFGIKKVEEKGVKWYDIEELCESLKSVVYQLKRFPTNLEFNIYNIPSVKTYIRYFGSLSKAAEAIGVRRDRYTKNFSSNISFYYDNRNNFCLSLSEVIISNILIDMNIDFKKEILYSEFIPCIVAGNRRCDWLVGDRFIEFFGMMGFKDYDIGANYKIDMCKRYNKKLLDIYPKDLKNINKLKEKILQFLK